MDHNCFWEKIISYVKKQDIIEDWMQKAYSIIFGQCSNRVCTKFNGMANHLMISENGNPILILENIKTITFNFQSTKYLPNSIHRCKRRLYTYSNKKDI